MKLIPTSLTAMVGRQRLIAEKDAPKVLFIGGVIGVVGSTVLACNATLKLHDVLDEAQKDMEQASTLQHRNYSETDRLRDKNIIRVRTVVNIGKLYAPAILLGGASIAALTKSHNMLEQRNLALMAAYATLDQAFGEYRERVIEKYGAAEDERLRFEHETYTDYDEVSKVNYEVQRVTPEAKSMYARFFDPASSSWEPDPQANFTFLRCQQNYWNDILKMRGHVVLNDVYRSLGIAPTTAGAIVGWVIGKGDHIGDNYIDFGMWDGDSQSARDFVNGREGSILLDFNVDGVIYDQIDRIGRAHG
jgi:hypothetical protein